MFGKLVAWLKVAEVGHDMGDFEAPDGFARARPAWWSRVRARPELRHRSQARPEPEPAAKHSGWQPRARTKRQVDHQWDGSRGWQVDHQWDGMAGLRSGVTATTSTPPVAGRVAPMPKPFAVSEGIRGVGQARPKPAVVTAPAPARPPVTDLTIDETHGLAPRWGTERAPLGPPNSSSDDGLTAARVAADLTRQQLQTMGSLLLHGGEQRLTQVNNYVEAAQIAAAKALAMEKIQKAEQDAEGLAKADCDRLMEKAEQEAEDKLDLDTRSHRQERLSQEQEAERLSTHRQEERLAELTVVTDDPSDLEQHFLGGPFLGPKGMGPWWARSGPGPVHSSPVLSHDECDQLDSAWRQAGCRFADCRFRIPQTLAVAGRPQICRFAGRFVIPLGRMGAWYGGPGPQAPWDQIINTSFGPWAQAQWDPRTRVISINTSFGP